MQKQKLPLVFVIILNYNGKSKLNACISSVLHSDYENLEVVIVDNGSSDSSFDDARRDFPKCHFIKSSKNFGCSRGNNLGLRWALEKFADFIFILNNDTLIETTTISTLVATMKKMPKAGIISPLIFKKNGKDVWFAGGKIDWIRMRTEHILENGFSTPRKTEYISGCAMLIRKDVFKKVGLFDERFFLYYEDADLSLRASRRGFELYIVPAARIVHLEQSSTENAAKTYWLVVSALLFFKIHANILQRTWHVFYLAARRTKNIYDLFFKKSRTAEEVRRAYRDFKTISF